VHGLRVLERNRVDRMVARSSESLEYENKSCANTSRISAWTTEHPALVGPDRLGDPFGAFQQTPVSCHQHRCL
jgi:hypothetical protein